MIHDHTPAEILRAYFVQQGLGVMPSTPGKSVWPIHVPHAISEERDNSIAIADTSSVLNGKIQQGGEVIEHPGVQIRARALRYTTARQKIKEIADVIDATAMVSVTVGVTTYKIHSITRTTGVDYIGPDENRQRENVVTNAILTITLA